MPEFNYDCIPAGYYDDIYHRHSGIQSKWHQLKFRAFLQVLRPGERVLDVGCGPGTFIGSMPETVRATGVDIAQSQVAYALEHYNSTSRTFQLIGPGQLPFEDSSFDLVTSIELIEHISMGSARQLLKESIRVLVPGGRIAISTPNYRSLWPLLEILVSQNGALSYADQHITQYTRAKLRALLTETGFVCVQVDAYQLIAPFAAALSWSLADIIATVEPAWLTKMAGLLLFGSAQKPQL